MYKIFRMYGHFPNIYIKKYVTFTPGSKRGGMTTYNVMYLKTVSVNTYMYLKQLMCCFLMHKA